MQKKGFDEPRINGEITGCNEVRLVYKSEGENKSVIIPFKEALNRASREGKDLIEVNGKANPTIVRIEEYSKYMYELKKQLKNNKKVQTTVKEIQLRTNIASNDLNVKANKARKFIMDEDKVKVVLTMKGRELTRREESEKCLYEFVEILSDISVPEAFPREEGNKCTVVLKKKK